MGTAVKYPLPDRIMLSFVIFDIRALWWCKMWRMRLLLVVVVITTSQWNSQHCSHFTQPTHSMMLLVM